MPRQRAYARRHVSPLCHPPPPRRPSPPKAASDARLSPICLQNHAAIFFRAREQRAPCDARDARSSAARARAICARCMRARARAAAWRTRNTLYFLPSPLFLFFFCHHVITLFSLTFSPTAFFLLLSFGTDIVEDYQSVGRIGGWSIRDEYRWHRLSAFHCIHNSIYYYYMRMPPHLLITHGHSFTHTHYHYHQQKDGDRMASPLTVIH